MSADARSTPAASRSPVAVLLILVVSIFTVEVLVMVGIMPRLQTGFSRWTAAFFDAGVLTALLSPLVYLFVFRPVLAHIRERMRAEEALRVANEALEHRVAERTSELSRANERLRVELVNGRRGQEALELQLAALNAAANAIVITDPDGVVLWINRAFSELTGYPADEIVGKTPRLLKSGAHGPPFYEDLWQTIRSGRVWRGELVNLRKDGTTYLAEETITPVRGTDGTIAHFVGIQQDITQRRQVEEDLARQREARHQSQKLAAMGELLAGVAHELNNPLSVVLGQAFLLRQAAGEGPLAARAERITQAAERCARIVKNFLALARHYPPERHEVQLNRVVQEAVELLAYALQVDNVGVTLDLASDLPPFWADPHQLHPVVVNLVTNAQQAMRPTAPPRQLLLATRAEPARARVRLEVTDTGPGIPPEIQARMFEPFFTTKAPGQGTGLGLSLCRGIVEAHGGSIRVESVPGRGTTFRVELPLTAPPATVREAPPASPSPTTRSRTILVVDDEAEVVDLLAEMLAADGHRVDTAPNGAIALERLRERTYDLILSDLRMPELDGPGLYRELERRHPELLPRVIFLTGDSLGAEVATFLRETGARGVNKPFALEEIRTAIARTLGAG